MSEGRTHIIKPIIWLTIFYVVGLASLKLSSVEEVFQAAIPVNILLSFCFMMYYQKHWNLRTIFFLIFTYIIMFTIQAIGADTGLIFGEFHYGKSLGVKAFGTPLIIGINWLILIYSTGMMVKNMKYSFWIQAVFASTLLLMFDVLLEPVAMRFGMWTWVGGKVPLLNYVAWFCLSYPLVVLSLNLKAKLRNDLAPYIFVIEMGFFLLANLF